MSSNKYASASPTRAAAAARNRIIDNDESSTTCSDRNVCQNIVTEVNDFVNLEYSQQYLDAINKSTIEIISDRTEDEYKYDKNERLLLLPNRGVFCFFSNSLKKETKKQRRLTIPCDFFETEGSIKEETCLQRAVHLGFSNPSIEILRMAKKEIAIARQKALDVLSNRVELLLVELAKIYLIKNKNGGYCRNAKQIATAFGDIKHEKEAENFWHVYYGSFDEMPGWALKLEHYLMFALAWQYDPHMLAHRGKKKSCGYRMANFTLNLIRKQLNNIGKRNCNYQLTKWRPKGTISAENKYDRRKVNVYEPYYLIKVSNFLYYLYLCDLMIETLIYIISFIKIP